MAIQPNNYLPSVNTGGFFHCPLTLIKAMAFDPRTNEGTTKRHVDIGYGVLTAIAAVVAPPIAIACLGAWFADRQHYPKA